MIKYQCKGCGKILKIDKKYIGTKGKCNYCGFSFIVPNNDDSIFSLDNLNVETIDIDPNLKIPPPVFIEPQYEHGEKKYLSIFKRNYSNGKICYYCKEEINKNATVCPYCTKDCIDIQAKGCLLLTIIIAIVFVCVYFSGSCTSNKTSKQMTNQHKTTSSRVYTKQNTEQKITNKFLWGDDLELNKYYYYNDKVTVMGDYKAPSNINDWVWYDLNPKVVFQPIQRKVWNDRIWYKVNIFDSYGNFVIEGWVNSIQFIGTAPIECNSP